MIFLHNAWNIMQELAPWLFLGLLVAGLLHVFVPRNFIEHHLGTGGFRSVIKAVLLGVPMPLCSCGVIPAALGIKKQGANDGASIAFLISTPQTGVDSIMVSASFLGWPFALFKVLSATVTGLVGGFITQATTKSVTAPINEATKTAPPNVLPKKKLKAMFQFAFNELLYMIWYWLVIGVLVSAAISTWLPKDFFTTGIFSGSIVALFLVLVISLPLYVCATSSVPIAAALVAAGMPPGAALVFLMAGPASNMATLGAVYRGFGARVLTVYLTTITVGSILFGYLFGFVLNNDSAQHAMAHEHGNWFATLCAILLAAAMLWFALGDLQNGWRRLRARTAMTGADETMEIKVGGMSCKSCAGKVEDALMKISGVVQVNVDLETDKVAITGRNLIADDLRKTIRDAGYKPV